MIHESVTSRCLAAVLILGAARAAAADQTVGLFVNDAQSSPGFTLFEPYRSPIAYLIDSGGLEVHRWETTRSPSGMIYLLENGHLLRAAKSGPGFGGLLEEYDWDGNLVWQFFLDETEFHQHHDIEPLPNGNVLILSREDKTAAEAIAEGRDPQRIPAGVVMPDFLAEIRPIPPNDAEVVWEWHVWDHMIQDFDPTRNNFGVVADHPERIDINYGTDAADWTHSNSIDYNAEFDQVMISVRLFDELWVIDHSTTTAEAAGSAGGKSSMGGDLLYRWGNPLAYRRGTDADRLLFRQHDAQWIATGSPGAGNVTVYSNGVGRPEGNYSSIEEIAPPVDELGAYSIDPGVAFGPTAATWTYIATPPESFYSGIVSGAERMPNGNTLICEGSPARFFEVTPAAEVVWEYVSPISGSSPVSQGVFPTLNRVFKIRRYAGDYPAFAGRDLTPGDPIEIFDAPLPPAGASLRVARLSGPGEDVEVTWDAASCTSHDYHLLWGDLQSVSSYALAGAECNVGISGTLAWTDAPSGSLYFVVVGTDDTGFYESTWGENSAGEHRNGTRASFRCGVTTKVVASTCP